MAKSYRELIVWQKSIQLTVLVYQLSKNFPREEIYGLTSQIRRAAVSVPSNIAEGAGRLGTAEYRHFLGISRGSNCELQTLAAIAQELGYLNVDQTERIHALSDEVDKMISATLNRLSETRVAGIRPSGSRVTRNGQQN